MEAAKKGIECLEDFFYNKLGLKSTLTEVGIDDKYIDVMAKKACNGKETLTGWKVLTQAQIAELYRACL
jgi:alcohol dehydrogenase YqhD (iron-dependent ADH family)